MHSTDAVDLFEFESGGHRVYLLDTPGFNDTKRSDIDTLGILAAYLGASYLNGVRIHGIIIMQPLNVNRMSGSAVRNINMIIAMCGFQTYRNVAIVTTMWPNSADSLERAAAERREEEIIKDESFFGSLVKQGAIEFRYNQNGQRDVDNEKNSAQKVVTYLLDQADFHPPEILQLQREVLDEKKRLGETTAGIIVAQELYEVRKGYTVQIQGLKAEFQDQLTKKDAHYIEIIQVRSELQKRSKNWKRRKKN
ncbi:hypothetical protein N7540_003255 [Penicillium herquei]|nr:hypothetical protein N7540_003255 [Penicillium herquei]